MRIALGGLLLVCAACAPTFEPQSHVEDRTLHTITPAQLEKADEITTPAVVRALSVRTGAVLAGTDQGVFLQRGTEAPQPVTPRVLDPTDAAQTGGVRAFAERPNGHLLVAAERGLFLWNDRELLWSPASQLVTSPVRVAAGDDGGVEHIAAVSGGALWALGDESTRLQPAAFAGAPDALALVGADVYAAKADKLVRLRRSSGKYEELALQVDFGAIRQLVVDPQDGALWVATDQGVLRRVQDGDGSSWMRWPLDGVEQLAVDPDGGAVWARTKANAVRVSATTEDSPVLSLQGTPGPLALDLDGNLWIADGGSARLWRQPGMQAPPPTFKADVSAFAQHYCVACHAATASLPLVTFEQWQRNAQRILLNLRVGTMPRGNPLQPGDFRVVERWINGGLQP